MAIAYVEHPVTKEEKRDYLKSKGFDKILDIRFAPKELQKGDKVFKKPKAKAEAK